MPEDLRFILADVLKEPAYRLVRVEHYAVSVGSDAEPRAEVLVSVRGKRARGVASGDGGYDAFMTALRRAAKELGLEVARLEDFRVRIPPGGRTAALVETLIHWKSAAHAEETFSTLGVDSDQLAAAVIATEKMLNALVAQAKGPR